MTKTIIIIGLCLCGWPSPPPVHAQDFPHLLKYIMDRLNGFDFDAIWGPVEFDLAYVPASTRRPDIVILEEIPAPPTMLDSLHQNLVDTAFSREERLVVQAPPIKGKRPVLKKEDLSADLQQADIAALRAQLPFVPRHPGEIRYLAARKMSNTYQYPDERLTLAETRFSMMERRIGRWKTRQALLAYAGDVLFLRAGEPLAGGQGVDLPVRWSFRRSRGISWEILMSGEVTLTFREVDGAWKVGNIEQLVESLYSTVVQ